jgi:hypothetical protein
MRSQVAALSLLTLISACAAAHEPTVIDNRNGKLVHVPRKDLHIQGAAYELRHRFAHPRAGGPSSGAWGDGGEIQGAVCGAQVALRVWHRGDHVAIGGQVAGAPASLQVMDVAGARQISGYVGPSEVSLRFDGHWIWGRVGSGAAPIMTEARPEIAAMPAADQAALLPIWLSCPT